MSDIYEGVDITKLYSQETRMQLEFKQRNELLSFFMNMSTYALQSHLIDISERHEGDCYDDESGWCNVCTFVGGNLPPYHTKPVVLNLTMWCECGHSFDGHSLANAQGHPMPCIICECEIFLELKMNTPLYRRNHNYRHNALKCVGCNKLNKEIVSWRVTEYVCPDCGDDKNE